MTRTFVALGSNLGDREGHLAAAVDALRETPGISGVVLSPLYETEPVGPPPQGPYLNAVAEVETSLGSRALLERLQAIEAAAGRVRGPVRDAPRTLDLDLLFFGEARISEPGLEVPHPRLHERAFVLIPLCDLAPDLVHPERGVSARTLLERIRDRSGVRSWRPVGRAGTRDEGKRGGKRWRSWP